MLRFWFRLALALTALPVMSALAADVPLPVKKPKDAKGVAVTGGTAGKDAPAATKDALPATDKAILKSTSPPEPAAKTQSSKDDPAGKDAGKDKDKASQKDAASGTAKAPAVWSPEEIETAKAHCTAILKGVDAVYIPETSFRDGSCGAPAPVRLVSIGKSPQVALNPPALLTCDMVLNLTNWVTGDLQPLAKKNLGAELVRIDTMSDYSCRAAYGRVGNKLSEHGHANALDIRGFVTAKGEEAMVLEGWGTPQREIAAAKAAEEKKAAAIKAAAEKSAAEQAAKAAAAATTTKTGSVPPAATAQGTSPAPAAGASPVTPRTTIVEGLPKSFLPPGIGTAGQKGLGLAPQQLGGPKEKDKPAGKDALEAESSVAIGTPPSATTKEPPARISLFLHEAHASACRIFGTTLGPEANNAHRNHIHVDMAPRTNLKICD